MKPKTYLRKSQLPHGGIPYKGDAAISDDLRRRIQQYDPVFGLYDFGRGQIYAYRQTCRVDRGEFLYVKEFKLDHKPGEWVLTEMMKCDSYRIFHKGDATKQIEKLYDEAEIQREVAFERKQADMLEAFTQDILTHAIKERKTLCMSTPQTSQVTPSSGAT